MAIGKLPDADADEGDETGGIFAEINITPLTDVFLVLLVIFMVSALAVQVDASKVKKKIQEKQEKADIAERSGIKVNLPAGQAQEIDTTKQSLVLVITQAGDVSVGGKVMADAELDNIFRAAFQKDKQTQVVLKADKGVAHGKVVNLMERAKQAGLAHLAIGTSG